jgi:hypothetical protein
MKTTRIHADGSVLLGADAEARGYRAGVSVNVVVLSTGSLLVTFDDTVPLDVAFRPLAGGAAQLALRAKRRRPAD